MPPAAAGVLGVDMGAAALPQAQHGECLREGQDDRVLHLLPKEDAETMLRMLLALFPETEGDSKSRFTWLRPDEVPNSYSRSSLTFQGSLVHEEHLTKVLQDQLTGDSRLGHVHAA